jgi:DNA-binding YbaB/EbfC family protein
MSNAEGPFGPGFDLSGLLSQAQEMQAGLMREMSETRATGTAGGGLVTATVDGGGELLSLVIEPDAVDPDDLETLADLVVAAVRDASNNARKITAGRMGSLTEGFGGMLGGLGDIGGAPGLPGPTE